MTLVEEIEFQNQGLEAKITSLRYHSECGGRGKFENGLESSSVKDSVETHRRLHPWKAAVDNCDPVIL